MTISQEDSDRLLKHQETPISLQAHESHHASTSGLSIALLASTYDSWIIDSHASAHMSSTQSLHTRLSKLSQPSSISVADGHACLVVGHGEANPASSLWLSQVLYVLNFPVNLLSINVITKELFCSLYLSLILSLPLHVSGFTNKEEDCFGA